MNDKNGNDTPLAFIPTNITKIEIFSITLTIDINPFILPTM